MIVIDISYMTSVVLATLHITIFFASVQRVTQSDLHGIIILSALNLFLSKTTLLISGAAFSFIHVTFNETSMFYEASQFLCYGGLLLAPLFLHPICTGYVFILWLKKLMTPKLKNAD
jgi:hypothetical protein